VAGEDTIFFIVGDMEAQWQEGKNFQLSAVGQRNATKAKVWPYFWFSICMSPKRDCD
jgi:hypothetical protein